MDKAQVITPQAFLGQNLVVQEAKKLNFLCAGRKWFKSTLFAMLAIQAAGMGKEVYVASLTHEQAKIVMNYVMKMVPRSLAKFNLSTKVIDFASVGR